MRAISGSAQANWPWRTSAGILLAFLATMVVVMSVVEESDHAVDTAELVREAADVHNPSAAERALGSMATLTSEAQESTILQQLEHANVGGHKGGSHMTMLATSDDPTAHSDVEEKVKVAVDSAEKKAASDAQMLGLTSAEAKFMEWKAGVIAKQEVIQEELGHAQRLALRRAEQEWTDCKIQEKEAQRHADVLEQTAHTDQALAAAESRRITTSVDPEQVDKWMEIYKQFHEEEKKSRLAAEEAEEQSAEQTIKCAKAGAHKEHVERLIKRAAAQIENVKAGMLNTINERAALVPKEAEREKNGKELKEAQLFQKLEEQVSQHQEQSDQQDKKVSLAQATVDKVTTQLKAAKKASTATSVGVDKLKQQLDKTTDTLGLQPSVQSKEDKQQLGAQIQALATNLTLAAKTKKRQDTTIAALEKQLHDASNALKAEIVKQQSLAGELEEAKNNLARKKQEADDAPNPSVPLLAPAEIAMLQSKRQAAPPIAAPPTEEAPTETLVELRPSDDAAIKSEQNAVIHDDKRDALTRELHRSQRENAELLQHAESELQDAQSKGSDIGALVAQLAEEETQSRPLPPDLLLIEEVAAAPQTRDSRVAQGRLEASESRNDVRNAADQQLQLALQTVAAGEQHEVSQADKALQKELKKLGTLEAKKEGVETKTQERLKDIAKSLDATEESSRLAESDARARLKVKLARIKATLQDKLTGINDANAMDKLDLDSGSESAR